jgi:hypothetical protein
MPSEYSRTLATRGVFERQGWVLLQNEKVVWEIKGKKIEIYGVDDFNFGKCSLAGIDPYNVDIFLIHEPMLFDVIVEAFPKLSGKVFLAGHTHGGQITFFGLPLYVPPGSGSYIKGLYEKNGNMLIVSKGLGNSGLQMRLFANYDISYINFRFDE